MALVKPYFFREYLLNLTIFCENPPVLRKSLISSLALSTIAESKAKEDTNNVNKTNNFIVNISSMLEDDILVTVFFSIFITGVSK